MKDSVYLNISIAKLHLILLSLFLRKGKEIGSTKKRKQGKTTKKEKERKVISLDCQVSHSMNRSLNFVEFLFFFFARKKNKKKERKNVLSIPGKRTIQLNGFCSSRNVNARRIINNRMKGFYFLSKEETRFPRRRSLSNWNDLFGRGWNRGAGGGGRRARRNSLETIAKVVSSLAFSIFFLREFCSTTRQSLETWPRKKTKTRSS